MKSSKRKQKKILKRAAARLGVSPKALRREILEYGAISHATEAKTPMRVGFIK